MNEKARAIVDSTAFQSFVTGVIVLAAVLVGFETYPSVVSAHGGLLHALDKVVLAIFVFEITLKLTAASPRPWTFFQDTWNVFDFVIVVAAFLPIGAQYATVLRLVRLLRVLRLVRALPKLQILVNALLKSVPSMGYVGLLLGLHFYVYGVAAVFMFGANDPQHFENLQTALLSLFTVVTMEGWADLMYLQMYGSDCFVDGAVRDACVSATGSLYGAPVYFITFILLGTMIILNLFIGVIMNGMQEATSENEAAEELKRLTDAGAHEPTLEHELFALHETIEELNKRVVRLKARAHEERRAPSA
jgi:voltage-gated sodium channel